MAASSTGPLSGHHASNLLPPVLSHLYGIGFDQEKALSDIKAIAKQSLADHLQKRWSEHEDELAPLAVRLVTIGKMSAANACAQLTLMHHVLEEKTVTGYLSRRDQSELPHSMEIDDSGDNCWIFCNPPTPPEKKRTGLRKLVPGFLAKKKSDSNLGKGGNGKVVLALQVIVNREDPDQPMRLSHQFVAVKKVPILEDRDRIKCQHEFHQLRKLNDNRHVISPIHISTHASKKYGIEKTNIFMEFANAGNLAPARGRSGKLKTVALEGLSDKEKWTTFQQILQALATMHAADIAHRDIKGDNIMLTRVLDSSTCKPVSQIRVIDLGTSIKTSNKNRQATTGMTAWYRPPEITELEKNKKASKESVDWKAVDVWQAAQVALESFCGHVHQEFGADFVRLPPGYYQHHNDEGPAYIQKIKNLPESLKPIIRGMAIDDPKKRWTAAQALEAVSQAVREM